MNRPQFSGFRVFANSNKLVLAPVCSLAFLCAGCFGAKRPTFHYNAAAMSRPVLPAVNPASAEIEVPDISVEVVMPPRFAGIRGPARPRSAPPAAPTVAAGASAEPTLVPGLSASELSSAKADTQRSLDIAEQNLASTQGKQLTAAQRDVISKIHVFIEGTHEAMRIEDWQRAKNFAKKAEVLSQELTTRP
jgi:hypothetical protein